MAMKPLAPKPMGPRKKATPVPLPKRSANGTARKITAGPKAKASSTAKPKPKKKPTLPHQRRSPLSKTWIQTSPSDVNQRGKRK